MISFVSLVSGFEILIKKIPLSKQRLPECHPYFGWQTAIVDLSQYAIPDYFNEFLVRINTVYSIEEFPCPLTNQFAYTKVASSEYGFEWALSSSGLLQMNKRFTESSLNLFYKSGDYRKITMGGRATHICSTWNIKLCLNTSYKFLILKKLIFKVKKYLSLAVDQEVFC